MMSHNDKVLTQGVKTGCKPGCPHSSTQPLYTSQELKKFEKLEDPGQQKIGFHLIARPHFVSTFSATFTELEAGIIVSPATLYNVRIALTQS